jgi:hypothetical protein
MAVEITDDEFEFLYKTFEKICTQGVDADEITEAIRAEEAIWDWLQRIKEYKESQSVAPAPK